MALMLIVGLIACARAAISALAPVGYEDDKGFHYGDPSREARQ